MHFKRASNVIWEPRHACLETLENENAKSEAETQTENKRRPKKKNTTDSQKRLITEMKQSVYTLT